MSKDTPSQQSVEMKTKYSMKHTKKKNFHFIDKTVLMYSPLGATGPARVHLSRVTRRIPNGNCYDMDATGLSLSLTHSLSFFSLIIKHMQFVVVVSFVIENACLQCVLVCCS